MGRTVAARRLVPALVLAMALWAAAPARAAEPDPLEPFNRAMFAFNRALVVHVMEPGEKVLRRWVPLGIRWGLANAYENITEPEFIVTNWFAGNPYGVSQSARRMIINTTLGVGGLVDVATMLGVERVDTEFGEAMCLLGVPSATFLVLPFIGSTNLVSSSLISGFFAVEWYVLAMISTILATADLVVDLSASAASLRYVATLPGGADGDPYKVYRGEYFGYMSEGCPAFREAIAKPEVVSAVGGGPAIPAAVSR